MDTTFFKNKKVLITGHTGFKGAWLTEWLGMSGANLMGISREAATNPNLHEYSTASIDSRIIDIRDRKALNEAFSSFQPEIVFHLAAQPLVRYSYKEPIETYETNVIGTLNVLEACKKVGPKAVVMITTDKCYENKEWVWGYRENDPMGGFDPYSSSKGCAEILIASYRNSFFNIAQYGKTHNTLVASARAGNVIGGGDWSESRLIPDIVKSIQKSEKVNIRSPYATRPWQHVLDPLCGYMMLAQKLFRGETLFAGGWNFGPDDDSNLEVVEMVKMMQKSWPEVEYNIQNDSKFHEANLLKLDCSKARYKLNWQPKLRADQAIEWTSLWYKKFYQDKKVVTKDQIECYLSFLRHKK